MTELRYLTEADRSLLNKIIRQSGLQSKTKQVNDPLQGDQVLSDDGHVYIAYVNSTGIAGLSGTTLGRASCSMYRLTISGADRVLAALTNPDATPYTKDIYNLSTSLVTEGYYVVHQSKSGPWVIGNGGSGDSSVAASCGCCDPFSCVSDAQATVGSCAACPNGAPDEYSFDTGTFTSQTQFGGSQTVTWDHDCVWLGPPMLYITDGDWAPAHAYSVGASVRCGGRSYLCTVSGTSASSGTGPSGTGTGIVDNTCQWDYSL